MQWRGVVAATMLLGAVTVAAPAAAVVYTVQSAGVYNYGSVRLTGSIPGFGAFDRREIAGPVVLNGTYGAGTPFSFVTYCFDILHSVSVGFGYQAGVSYQYAAVPVTNDLTAGGGTGNPLSTGQVERISGLARLGANLFLGNASDLTARMSAIQAAIWSVEYGFVASEFDTAGAQDYYNDYMSRSFAGSNVPVLVASDATGLLLGNVQGMGVGSVPEPASWAMLIAGLGLVGAVARRRHALAWAAVSPD